MRQHQTVPSAKCCNINALFSENSSKGLLLRNLTHLGERLLPLLSSTSFISLQVYLYNENKHSIGFDIQLPRYKKHYF